MNTDHPKIIAELKRLEPWFHRIDLGNGLFTKTESVSGEPADHPAGVWRTISKCLPQDLTGKTVLDVGCNAGFYSIEAKRRGAQRVLGVDGQRQHVRQASFVRQVLGLDIEYRRINVYDLTSHRVGEFDVVLALGLLYHLKHLVLAIENLYEVTGDLLIIETAIMPPARTPDPFEHMLGRLHPLVYIDNPPQAKEQVFNWFLPSVSALEALLRNTGFSDVQVIEVKNERAVVMCRKSTTTDMHDVLRHYVAAMTLLSGAVNAQPDDTLKFVVRCENIGVKSWPAGLENEEERGVVHLGAHLLRANGDEVDWDYGRTELPSDLKPGEVAEVELMVRAPQESGDYIIEFDMVAEHISWFEDAGKGILRHNLQVE